MKYNDIQILAFRNVFYFIIKNNLFHSSYHNPFLLGAAPVFPAIRIQGHGRKINERCTFVKP